MNNHRWFGLLYSYLVGWILKILALLLGRKLHARLERKDFGRIIEIAEKRVRFSQSCRVPQQNNYLGLLRSTATESDKLDPYVLQADSYFSLKRNNADLLILADKPELERLWYFDEYKHARYIFLCPSSITALGASLPGLIKNSVFRRLQVAGVLSLKDDTGIEQTVLAIEILKRVMPNARRFVSPWLGVLGFFQTLNQQQIDYAILRWFEDLPQIEPGEDIDMLVADKDIDAIETLLRQQPGIVPCDIYTVSGLPGTSYRNMAYYPPLLAEQILANTVLQDNTFAVPQPEIHFYSLAYHAIYHKGIKSGIPWCLSDAEELLGNPEHEYTEILQDLARSLQIEVDITLEALDRWLKTIGWRPSEDTLARLDSSQLWLRAENKDDDRLKPNTDISGLAVFYIRQKALDLGLEAKIIELLENEGFSIIKRKILGEKKAWRVKHQIRGGNWGRGPWAESGGDPAMVLVALDLMPIPPSAEQLAKQPHLSNGRIGVKNKIRDLVNTYLPPERHCNTVHSSDNEREAWNYLEITFPKKLNKLQRRINRLRADFETNYAVRQILTRFGRRAKVEVIQYNRQLAVKKTFRPGCEKFLQRELLVGQTWGEECAAIPQILDYGDNYLVVPYYTDVLRFRNRQSKLLPLKVAKEAVATLKFFYDHGYALIDFQPANIIVDRTQGLKVIDFEFLYQYTDKPKSFTECYELAGIPDDFAGDRPNFKFPMSYDRRWKPYVGLSLTSLLEDPTWLQHLKRSLFALTRLPLRAIDNRLKLFNLDEIFSLNLATVKKLILKLK